ncbi:MAG TPA: peptidoglycan DD-metalloendopeptidase family protein, partial [Gemmataceae bacterium]|nr:peptidoglycan DD-metalloendopeptidase family protein [Gemmataceae bacterium]
MPISAVNDWTATGNFFYAGSQFANSHSTPGYEALAKPDGSKGNNLVGEIYQQFTIPDNATSVVLTYWVNVSSDDAGASKHDVLNARILNSSGSTLAAVGSYSNLNRTTAGTYQQATFDLSAFHGLTVRLDFLATTDASNPTVFRIDDVSVIATTTPHISAINPAQPIVDSSRQWVSIVGTGFGSSSTVTVYAGSIPYPIPVDRLQYRSSGQIDVYVGLTEARTDWSVEVKNSDGAISPRLTFPVVPKAVQLTDFAVSAVSGNPISLLAGDQATVSFLVTNQSNVAAPATSAKLRLDSGTTVADADPLLADVTVPALGAGQSQPLTKVVTIPTGTAAGSYYVGVMVNPTGSVQEIDRSNNQGVMAITVTASPQPQIFGSPTTTLAQSTSPQSVSLTGINFNPGATVRLHDPSGNLINGLVTGQNNTTSITVSQVFGSIGNWLVEVINPGAIISSAFHLGVADAATIPAVGNDLALRLPFEGAHPVTQEFKGPNVHSGIDFGMPEGTKIVAVADGEVVKVDPQNIDPNPGIFVKIKHHGRTSDWYSLYYHLKQRMVDVGDKIKQGDVIGYSGNTGTSTGPHLHFEMRAAAGDQNAAKPPVPMTGQVLASDGSVKSTTITSFDLGTTYRPTLPSVSNGSFLSGIMASWSTIGHGVADAIQHTLGDWWARLTTHSPVDLSQAITTPSQSFDLTFDYQFQTTTGALDVSLNSVPLGTIPAPSSLPTGPSKFRITVTDPSLLAQTNAVLDFHFDGAANSEIDLTNIATETNPPSAVSGAADISTGGATTQDFTVTYADNVAVDVSTLHTGNILVTGPNGYSQVATFVGVDNNTNGSPRSATYRITAPNGKWGSADNGTYTLSMQFNQVSDTRGYFVPYGIFGSFAVAIPPAPINDLAWQYKASLPQALTAPLGAVLNGKVYVAGGPDYYGYDPSTNTWTTLASVPAGGFHDGGAVAIGSKLYGIGFGASPVTEIYDPVSNSWSAGAAMPTPRFYGAVAEVGGKVYAIGGQDSVGNISGKVEAYDPATNTWVSRAAMLTPRASTTAVSLNGLIYVFAGTGANLSDLTAVEVYDPATNTWASKSHMPTIRAGAGAVVLGGKIYVVGGFDGGTHNLASVDEYDPGTDSWRTLPSGLLTPRVSAVTVVVNGNAYVIGGSSDTGPLSTVEAGVSRQHFAIVGTTSGTAGSAFTFTVTALTSSNATDTTYNGTVHFSSSDSQAVLPADATLVGGVGTFSVTFGTAGLQMLTATDTLIGSITGTTGITGGDPINVTPAAATHLSVNVFSNPVAGSNFSFNVTAVDQFNNTDTNYIGTVHFSSTDAQAALPADATLTNGFGNFNGILNTPGSQTLTAADTATSSINGSSAVTVVVGIPTSMALGVSTVFAAYEQAVTLTATVAVVPPNTGTPNAGTVTFMDGTTPIGSAPVNAGTATFVTTSITVGTHALTAYYSGFGSNYADSRSGVAPNSIITTFAGNGSATYGGDNGPATAAVMTHPQGVAVDGSGNVFIADSYNNRIRRVDASTGIITTITGNGTAGFSGDGGLATAAALNFATGNSPTPNIAVDANGHLFIADTNNNRVREVDLSTGIITTVAGNGTGGFSGEGVAATAASLSLPVSVAVDANGNLYVTDNQRIRKVTASTGVITTVAGNGLPTYSGDGGLATAASLRNPAGLAVDSNGNIYIADCSNYRIRKVTASTGVITTVAGNGSLGSGGDGGLATLAQLYIPTGVAVDSSGNILIADQSNNRIRKVTVSTGMITTIAGSGTAG